jgi:RNA polymerase II subunit A C-terminal domain phosphatase
MLLRLPKNLHYPITVTKVVKPAGDSVARNDHLFLYSYETTVTEGSRDGVEKEVPKKFVAQFESSLDGMLRTWRIWEGDVIAHP